MPPRLPTTDLIDRPRSQGFHAQLGDIYVRLAPERDRPYVVTAPEAQAPRFDTGQTPEEFITATGQVFARSDFTGGEGLAFAHRINSQESDVRRFWDSANVRAPISDPGTPLYLDMARAYRTVSTSLTSIVSVVTVPTTERVVIVAAGGWEAWDDLDDPVNPTLAGSGTDFTGATMAAGIGDTVYVVNGTNTIWKITDDGAGSFSVASEVATGQNWTKIWAAKERLFVALDTGGALYEYQDGAGAPTAVTTEREIHPAESWTTVVDVGTYVAAGSTNGLVYFYAPTSLQDPDLTQVASSPMPQDEQIVSMAYNQGVLLIGTKEFEWDDTGVTQPTGRLYQANIAEGLVNVQLVKRWNDISGPVPQNMITTRDSIYFTTQDGSYTEVWRFLLPTLGLFREDHFATVAEDPVGMANPGQLAMIVHSQNVWLETGNATSEDAWLILPAVDFFTAQPKAWTELRVSVGNVPNGAEIDILVSTEYAALQDWMHISWRTVRTIRSEVTEVTVPLSNVHGRYLIVQIRMRRGTSFESAELLSFTAIGRTDDEEEVNVMLPVIVSDSIQRPYRKPIRSNGYGELLRQYINSLKGTTVDIEVYRPSSQIRGVISGTSGEVRHFGRRGHPIDILQVMLVGRRVTTETVALTGGEESLGVGLLGVSPILGGTNDA